MIPFHRFALVCHFAGLVWCASTFAGDWITAPSYYTHDPSGQRVQQYTPIGPFYLYPDPTYQKSGYRHTRSSLQVGNSVDHYHVVEEWGKPVRPYDEWRFPYRPYSAPYPEWGPPFLPFGFGGGFWGGPGIGVPGGPFPGGGFFGGGRGGGGGGGGGGGWGGWGGFSHGWRDPAVPYFGYQPWFDDRYPAFDDRAPFRYQPFPKPFGTRPRAVVPVRPGP